MAGQFIGPPLAGLLIASTVALIYLAYRALALTLFHDPALVAV